MYKFALLILHLLLLCTLITTACDRTTNNQITTPQATSLLIHLTRTPTQTPTITHTPTHIPDATLVLDTPTPFPSAVPATVANTATPTHTPLPSVTPSVTPSLIPPPTLTATLAADEIALRLLAGRNPAVLEANQSRMLERVRLVQAELRSMVFQINDSGISGIIDCSEFHRSYEDLLAVGLHFNASAEFRLPNFYYNRAVERGIIELHLVEELCQSDERWQKHELPTSVLETETLSQLFVDANQIIYLINEAMAWLVGDVGRTRELYKGVRDQMRQYGILFARRRDRQLH